MQIELKGGASGRSSFLDYAENDLELTLLEYLRMKKVTIASSCEGEGVCKRCSIQNGWLTCEMTLKKFLQRQPDRIIEVSYL